MPEPPAPTVFSSRERANSAHCAVPFSTTSFAANGGCGSSSIGSATDSAATISSSAGGWPQSAGGWVQSGAASAAGTGELSAVESAISSAPRSMSTWIEASTWIEGGGSFLGATGRTGSNLGAGTGVNGCGAFGASGFLMNGVPQSKQNFAAGGLAAPQVVHGFSVGPAPYRDIA